MAVFELTFMKKSLAILIAACSLLLAGCCTAYHGKKWEYRMATTLAEVNQLAEQGWIVVNFGIPNAGPYQYLMKRPKK
jgi:hypothetical protein